MELGSGTEVLLNFGTTSSASSSSIFGTVDVFDDSSLKIFLEEEENLIRLHSEHDVIPLHALLTDKTDAWRESPASAACWEQACCPPARPPRRSEQTGIFFFLLLQQLSCFVLFLRSLFVSIQKSVFGACLERRG